MTKGLNLPKLEDIYHNMLFEGKKLKIEYRKFTL